VAEIMPIINYTGAVMDMPVKYEKELTKKMFNFLWHGPDKIKRRWAVKDWKEGGVRAPLIKAHNWINKVKWIMKMRDARDTAPWMSIFEREGVDWGNPNTYNTPLPTRWFIGEDFSTQCIRAWTDYVCLRCPAPWVNILVANNDVLLCQAAGKRWSRQNGNPTVAACLQNIELLQTTNYDFLTINALRINIKRFAILQTYYYKRRRIKFFDTMFRGLGYTQKQIFAWEADEGENELKKCFKVELYKRNLNNAEIRAIGEDVPDCFSNQFNGLSQGQLSLKTQAAVLGTYGPNTKRKQQLQGQN
jgi:hypothetical protein